MSENQEISKKEQYNLNKLQKRLRRCVGEAIADFNMIEEGDRVMVCLSGGKDSYTMLEILRNLQQSAPVDFTLVAVNLDQKQPGFPETVLPAYLENQGIEYRIVEENTYGIVKEKIPEGKTTCSLCSRLRRGILYRTANELHCNKIALGHHRDDMLETLFLNMFYGGKLKGMPPKLMSDDGQHIVIRPLAYCREKDIERLAAAKAFPIIPCNLCGSQPNLQRQVIKEMLRDWDKRYPGRIETMFRAMQNVVPSHLADGALFDFKGLLQGGEIIDGGDLAFDRQIIPLQPVGLSDDADRPQTDGMRLDVVEVK
ncbi:tRNA 2-thiocytidine(32) synthetase TtcA [Edwardsiella ictaluri]|uniref:tRNA 2-thiocytidine(32) synthetase TtcA n=1 Tax=Edwardsiella ictaluri TaxID=67780 RepID=UPI003784DB3F